MRPLLVLLSLISLARAELDSKPLETWIGKQKDLQSLDTRFVQERKLPSLKKPVSTPGRMRMQRPGKLCWELGQPVKTMAVSDGQTMTLLDVSKKRGKRIDADSGEARQFTLTWRCDTRIHRHITEFSEAWVGPPSRGLVRARQTGKTYLTLDPAVRMPEDAA